MVRWTIKQSESENIIQSEKSLKNRLTIKNDIIIITNVIKFKEKKK